MMHIFKKDFGKSIRFRFLVVMAVVLLISTVVLSIVISLNEKRVLYQSLMDNGKSLASLIAKSAAEPLVIKDGIQLDSIVNDATSNENVVFAVISDEQGNPLTSRYASVNYRSARYVHVLSGLERESELPGIIDAVKRKESVIECSAPVMIGVMPIGKVTVGISGHLVRQQTSRTILFVVLLNFGVAFVLGTVLFVASRKIVLDPIRELVGATTALSDGDLSTRVKVSGTGEVGMLVDSFNQMLSNLEKVTVSRDYVDQIIKSMTDTLLVVSPDNKIVLANTAALGLLGYKEKELIGRPLEMVLGDGRSPGKSIIDEIASRNFISNRESFCRTKDGHAVPILMSGSNIAAKGKVYGVVVVAKDITERKRAEEALSRSGERYRNLFEDSPISLWEEDFSALQEHLNDLRSSGITDLRAYFEDHPEDVYKCIGLVKIIAVNKATLGLYEAPDQAALTQNLSRVFTAKSFESFRDVLVVLAEGARTYECEAANQTLTGREINVLLRWSLLPWSRDQGSRALVSIVDITERKQAEEKIRQSEEFIRSILDSVDEGFIVVDRDYRILTANKAYCGQVSLTCDEVIGRRCHEISHKTDRPCHEQGEDCAVLHVFETGESCSTVHRHADSKGDILFVETKAFPIKDNAGAVTSVIEVINNITEKYLLEEERLKTQKLEAIGTLAGGIAHDFNNLLQGVFGYVSMARAHLDQKEITLELLQQAEKALHISVGLTSQLLTFSKGGKPVKKKIKLRPLIEDAVKFALSGSRVGYNITTDKGLWTAEADEGQIGQVVQNIVLNADQAMPMGGAVEVAARNVHSPAKGLPPVLSEGNYVEISVMDHGIGIPENYLSRIFDPYFTTKDKGSGLGLATSYSIVKNHGGLIEVKSEMGKGSTFFIYLPAFEAEEEKVEETPGPNVAARRGRILVMDDEELVRNIVGRMIKSLGHEVEVAENGEEAVAKYSEALSSRRSFDVVILDLTIRGGKGGEETLRELLEVYPGVKAVVSSGYTDSSAISEYESLGFKACLTKPYEIDELRKTLDSLC